MNIIRISQIDLMVHIVAHLKRAMILPGIGRLPRLRTNNPVKNASIKGMKSQLTKNEQEFFKWFEAACEKVCQPDYSIIPAWVPNSEWRRKAIEMNILPDTIKGCECFDFQKKHQRRFNTISNRVARKYNLRINDSGVFYADREDLALDAIVSMADTGY